MSEFRFNEDFAGNWEAGQIVICEEKSDGYLVDNAALIDKNELLKHGEFITMNVEILGQFESNGADYKFVYDRDFQQNDIVEHFKGGFYKIITFGINTETKEKMVVYQGLANQKVWITSYAMFASMVDREKYPNTDQPYRFIKVKIAV